ncbi:hypothetical protein PIROE2DRAFT_10729 [Piromyces sp. E2]|nr:hypothetical protein PIROE2DRAFT_10729 [Piromyces sp. E2]|eukprot:OUM62868.1 hypothetical protein PIROE2DRAFT_10729 [Piromyces sp. E2]
MEIIDKTKIEKNINYYIESFFENAHYTEEVLKVKNIIINKINEEYELEKEKNNKNAFEVIIQRYNNLETMVKNIGYDASVIDLWFNMDITSTHEEFKNVLIRKKFYIYIITVFGILSDHPSKELITEDLQEDLEHNFDKYAKKCLVWLFILFIKLYEIVLNAISLSLNSEVFELREELKKMLPPLINSISYIYESNNTISYNEDTGIYTIVSNSNDFKILQLTDIHLGGGVISFDKDVKAIEASYKIIKHTKPDLVVVTGDLTYPVGLASFSLNNKAPVSQFAAFMRNTGVPWVFTYGNHDTEGMAIGNKEDIDKLYKSLSWKTSKNLLYPYIQPELDGEKIWGRNNQLIEVRNSDGTLNQALFLIDSNDYMGSGFSKYDYIHDDQVEWYKNEVLRLNHIEGKTISSLVFFHIPVQQYKIAYDLFINGSDEVKYYFGSNDEKRKNVVCTSKHPSKLFDTAKELNSTKGFFCGHDHYNNMSLEYQGIRHTYGMSIDYLVEPGIARDTKQRGGTLIISHNDGTVDIEQIPLTSIEKESEKKK